MVGRDVEPERRREPGRDRRGGARGATGSRRAATAASTRCADVSFSVRAGEILGVAGVAGNGQRELAEVLTGMRPRRAGVVEVDGRRLRDGDPRAAIRAGVAHVPEDRLRTGVAPSLSIASNVVLKSYRGGDRPRGPFLRLRRIRDAGGGADPPLRRPRRRARTRPARQLSGGNLQKVVLAREFSGEPTRARRRGADARARRRRDRDRPRIPARRRGRGRRRCC